MEKLVCGLCCVPLGDSTQQVNSLSSKYWSPVCQQLHPSCNQASRYRFWTPSWWTPVVIRLVGELSDGSVTWWLAGSQWEKELLSRSGCRNLLPLPRLNAVIHHYLLTLYVGEEDEMSSRSKTWAKHHWYIKIQIFLSLLTWQKPVKFVNSKLYSACLHYVQIIWGEVAWF